MTPRDIKELSIALDALSRTPASYYEYMALKAILEKAIKSLKEIPSPKTNELIDVTKLSDDISF